MKRDLLKLFALIALFSLPLMLVAQSFAVRLDESFENGIPSTWTQENVKGDINWVVNSGDLTYPKASYDGNSRVEFKGNSNITSKATTRLITPALDIQGIYQPIMVFAHAQSTWTDDFDTLKIYYRANANMDWTLLKVYDYPIKKWALDTLRLIGGSKTYQIAFEASDNLGRGVVIDDILVRSTPRCEDPYGFNVSSILNESAIIGWFNDGDAQNLSLKVSTVALTAEQLADENFKANVLDTLVAKNLYRHNLTGLKAGTKYYYYLRANCGGDISNWAGSEFETSNVIKPGFTMNFNTRSSSGVTYPANCYVGSSDNVTPPYINTGVDASAKKQLSPDASTVVCFNAEVDHKAEKAIPSSSYAYFALPQVELDENKTIADLYVSFTTINHAPYNSNRFSLIVGVMDDPVDYYSFIPVDTVNITSMRAFEEVFVSLEKYTGEGKFIAFSSEFESSNIFLMDNLKVDYRPDVLKVNNFQMQLTSATTVKFDFPFSYDKYEVVLAEKAMSTAELDAASAEVLNNGGFLTIKPATHYYVYARAIKGSKKGTWSDRRILHTVGKIDALPYELKINIDREKPETYYQVCYENSDVQTGVILMPNLLTIGNSETMFGATDRFFSSTRPWIIEAKAGKSNKKCWTALVLPELNVDLKTTRLSFEIDAPDNNGSVIVGCMADARDINTFKPLTTFSAVKGYSYQYVDFVNYDIEGKFIAILVEQDNGITEIINSIRLDKIKFAVMPSCGNVTNIVAVTPNDPSKINISWDNTNADAWIVCLSKSQFTYESIDKITNWDYKETVTTNSIEISNLKGPGHKYYYTVCAVCNGVQGEWSHPASFETGCYDVQPVPYSQNFDELDFAAYSMAEGFKVPCMATQQVTVLSSAGDAFYPQIQQEKTTYAVYMRRGPSTEFKNLYLAMPKMAEPINNLQISFDVTLKTGLTAGISVGVMTNPYDSTTFEEVVALSTDKVGESVKFLATLDSYQGQGEYIAISLNNNCTYDSWLNSEGMGILFDNIRVEKFNPCARPEGVTVESYDHEKVKLRWRSPSTVSKWRVLFSDTELTETQLDNIVSLGNSSLKIEEVSSNPCTITGLDVNVKYFIYVQPLCGSETGAWSEPAILRTPCEIKTVGELGVEDFESYIEVEVPGEAEQQKQPACWTVGNMREGAHDEGYIPANYVPHCITPETSGYGVAVYEGNSSLLFQTVKDFNGAYAISNKIDIDDISKIYMKLMGRGNTDLISDAIGSIIVGIVTDPLRLNTFVPVDTLNFITGEYLPYEVYFETYEGDQFGDKGQYVMFLADFGKEVKVNVLIDNVEFDTIPACRSDLEIDSIGIESIRVKLLGGQAPYQVKYSRSELSDSILNGNTVDSIVSLDNTIIIPNLKKVTPYYISARASCDGHYIDWSPIEMVTTDWNRVVKLPYFDDFEDQPSTTQTRPECWYSLYTGAAKYPYPYVYGANGLSPRGTHGIYMYLTTQGSGGTTYLVTPEIDVDSLSRCQVSFYEKNATTNKRRNVIIGAVSDVNDIAGTFEPIDTLIFDSYPSLVSYDVTVTLDKYKGGAKHIAFTSCVDLCQKYSTTKGWIADNSQLWFTIDDILIELIPTCFPGTNFRMVGHTDSSLEIEFNHEDATKFEVKYGAVGFNVDSTGASMNVEGATRFTIKNLNAATEYDVYVRTICNDEEISTWAYAGKYKTAPEAVRTMPYSFNFDDTAEAAKWNFTQAGQTNQWFIGVDDAQVVADKGGKALYISNDGAKSAHYSKDVVSRAWASRTVALEAGVYTISYDWTCFGETNNDYIRVGLLPTTSQFNAGSATVVNLDGTSGALGNNNTENRIQNWIELSDASGLSGVDITKPMAEQWNKVEKAIIVTPEMEGLYNMVFYWVNNDSIGEYADKRSAVIDNISIKRESCTPPYELKLIAVNSTGAKFAVSSIVDNATYDVVAFDASLDEDNLTEQQYAFHKQLTGNTITINGLTAGVNYKVNVRTICSAGDNSIWVGPFEFTTSCNPIELNTLLTMDNENEHYSITASNGLLEVQKSLPNCFVSGHEIDNMVANYSPALVKNTENEKYARSGNYALKLSNYPVNKESVGGDYVVLPLLNSSFETSQVNFWMRSVTNNAEGKVNTTGVGATYARKITVGTMTNPYDPTTFVAIGTYEYSYTAADMGANISEDVSGNNYWIEVSVPLIGATGEFVAFKNEGYGATNNIVYIDDIEFVEISCFTPNSLRVSNISSNSATIDFNHSEAIKYVIQRADNAEFANAQTDVVTTLPFKMENLSAATNYYVRVQTICTADTSNWSPYVMFTTNKTTAYVESFDKIVNNINGWQTSNSCSADDCFAGTDLEYLSKLSTDTWTTEGGIAGMKTMHVSTKVNNLASLPIASYGSKTWLISPVIDLVKTAVNYHLMFDLALTDMDSNEAPTEEDKVDTDDRFMVIISEDEGATWSKANAIIWGTSADDYEYFSIPVGGKRYEIDLTKYAGKQIRIAFYAESNKVGASTEIHLDNVHVNVFVQDIVEAPVCQTEGFENSFFSFESEELTVGVKEISYWELHAEAGQVDTLRGVKLNVLPMFETTLDAQMCEGDVYALNGFSSITEAGRYKQKVRSVNGCDSVIILNLTTTPIQRVTTADTICSGAPYIWNGRELTRTGIYTDTLISVVTNCDSIVMLALKVNDPIETAMSVNICYGNTYEFGSQVITKTGNYKEIFKTVDGCDSIVLLNATILPDYRLVLNETIKKGEKYKGHGFDGLSKSGTYTLPLKSKDGCDSTVTLNLTVLDGDTTYVEFTITTDDLPYDYETIHYGEDTKPGVYVDTIVITDKNGDKYVVVHKLTIEAGTAVEEVRAIDLIMVPNPVHVNGTLFINAEFITEERDGLVVEVFNSIGQRVYMDTPFVYPIAINGLNATGVYVVRVVTGNGKSYFGKVIVE